MNPNDTNAILLESVARRLGEDLLGDFVFVGGAAPVVIMAGTMLSVTMILVSSSATS